jgi:predicted regulator of amino acid metabolism with ACT domain
MNLKKIARATGVGFLAIAATQAHAAGDLASLTGSISFADVGVAIMAVAAAVIGYHVLKKGALEVIAFMKKA